MPQASAPSPLLDLPPELRDRILGFFLLTPSPISLEHRVGIPYIAQVNQCLREEALQVFFERNTFAITNRSSHAAARKRVAHALSFLLPEHLARIRHLRLDWNTYCLASSDDCLLSPPYDQHVCLPGPSYAAPVYMAACYVGLTWHEPALRLSVDVYDNDLCRTLAKPLYEKMSDAFTGILASWPLASNGRRVLDANRLHQIADRWDDIAEHALRIRAREIVPRYPAALQDFQMQLMLLEQLNRRRLLRARQSDDTLQ